MDKRKKLFSYIDTAWVAKRVTIPNHDSADLNVIYPHSAFGPDLVLALARHDT
jgi:hypothetical protein